MSEEFNISQYLKTRDTSKSKGTYVAPSAPVEPINLGSSALKTVTDFENNEQVQQDYETTMEALARNKSYTSGILDSAAYSDDGPAEFLRDLSFRIGTKVNVATEVKNWSLKEKQAFKRLRQNWDNVSVTGMSEYMGAIKD